MLLTLLLRLDRNIGGHPEQVDKEMLQAEVIIQIEIRIMFSRIERVDRFLKLQVPGASQSLSCHMFVSLRSIITGTDTVIPVVFQGTGSR